MLQRTDLEKLLLFFLFLRLSLPRSKGFLVNPNVEIIVLDKPTPPFSVEKQWSVAVKFLPLHSFKYLKWNKSWCCFKKKKLAASKHWLNPKRKFVFLKTLYFFFFF